MRRLLPTNGNAPVSGQQAREHVCDTGHFDRTICPEPCGSMHSFCATCGERQDPCAHDASTPEQPREAHEDRDEAVRVAAEAIDAEWMRPEHGCDGTETVCLNTCPVPAFHLMNPDQLRDTAARAAVAAARPVIEAEALRKAADEWSEWETFVAADGHTSIREHEQRPDDWLRARADRTGQAGE